LGYQVTLVDLSRNSLTLAAEKAAEAQIEIDQIIHANVLDLGMIPSSAYQAAIIMGPLYHLLDHKERVRAVKEALRVVEPGGIVGAAFITRFAPFRQAAVEEQEWLVDEHAYAMNLLEKGIHDQTTMFANAYFIHPYDVEPLMESVGLQTILLIGVEGIVAGHEEGVNALQGSAWETWVELNYQLGQDASLYGASDHLLYLGQKPTNTNP
jgi:SAM-dependent methyltransferase